MELDSLESSRDITIVIRKVANGYVLRIYRPAKPYQSQNNWETKEMVFMGLEPCLDFSKKFLQNPWESQVGS